MPRTWALAAYDAVLRQVVVTHKDEGRTALCSELAVLWRAAMAGAVAGDATLGRAAAAGRLVVVPVPSSAASTRRRGRDPWRDVVFAGLAGEPRLRAVDAVRVRRAVRDQAGLTSVQRAVNLSGAMALRNRVDVSGAVCVLTDDVVTTGATLAEGARVLRGAGAEAVIAVVIAATQRRRAGRMTTG